MLSPHSIKPLAALLLAASSLATIHSRALAQADDIPETVLVTGSLIPGYHIPGMSRIDPGRLTQLTDRELRTVLRGASVRTLGDHHVAGFACNGSWSESGDFAPVYGRYSIRHNQYCVEAQVNAASRYCVKLFRSNAGKLFAEVQPPHSTAGTGPSEVEITPADPPCSSQRGGILNRSR